MEHIRKELKYIVSTRDAFLFMQVMQPVAQLDPNTLESGHYQVSSLYFDDDHNSFLREKLNGVMKRSKFRIRLYNDDLETLKLESKQKNGDHVKKKSLLISTNDYHKFIKSPSSFGYDFPHLLRTHLIPKTIIKYDRKAFVYPHCNVRITIDTGYMSSVNVKPDLLGKNTYAHVLSDELAILEVKYTDFLPEHIRCLLSGLPSKQAFSKYANARLLY